MAMPIQLQKGEKVIRELRRHPIYAILQAIGIIIVAGLLIWLFSWLGSTVQGLKTFFNILLWLTILVAAVALYMIYYRYKNDLWLITDQRLVDSTRRSPFSHEIASTDLVNVQDITVNRSGFFPTIFNFGEVSCQTAGSTQVFTLNGVPNPNSVLELIDQSRDDARERLAGMGRNRSVTPPPPSS